MFFSRLANLQVMPFYQEGMMRVESTTISDVQSIPSFFLNNGYNNHSSAVQAIKDSTSRICYTSDVVWTVPHGLVVLSPASAVAEGSVYAVTLAIPIIRISHVAPPPPIQSPAPPLQPSPPKPASAPPLQPRSSPL